ncbi:biotin transporter BioY [uncultured Nocardioides sp.]|uniref:biotin transporter BioY n=1 Tax=uncultured Nocardioides sp. TaxID=198441 RepID=UPI00261DF067|nr:biotin transporter BioY [uncultured Nocardioides sp.]
MATRRSAPADVALIAGFAALIAVCALLPAIPTGTPVPITLQTFAVLLAGACLGARRGFLAVLLYVVVGAAGLPVFSGGASGFPVLVGPTAGYLLGFPFAAALTGFLVERLPRRRAATSIPLITLSGLAGSFAFIHTLGITGLVLLADLTWGQAFAVDLVFWPGDVVKNLAVGVVATAVHRAFADLLPRRRTAAARKDRAPA